MSSSISAPVSIEISATLEHLEAVLAAAVSAGALTAPFSWTVAIDAEPPNAPWIGILSVEPVPTSRSDPPPAPAGAPA